MADDKLLERVVILLERKIALDLHFREANQDTIAHVLGKSKTWVNDLLKGVPKCGRS
jgi:hypothetical protein